MSVSRWLSLESWKRWLWSFIRLTLIAGLSFVILYPILQNLDGHQRQGRSLFTGRRMDSGKFHNEYFLDAIRIMDYWETLFNTFALSATTTVLTAASCALAGYGFARLKFKGSQLLFACVVLTILVPPPRFSSRFI